MMGKLLFTDITGHLVSDVKPILDKRYDVTTIGTADNDMLKADFAKAIPVLPTRYDIVLHTAGKPSGCNETEAEKRAFFDINYIGTIHLCDALERIGLPRAFIFISTSAVYGEELGENIDESAPLTGKTPYAQSMINAEQYLTLWCKRHDVRLGILRPSLLVGIHASGDLEAMVRVIAKGRYFNIAGGKAHRSLLMTEDIANIVPLIAEKGGVYNVCDNRNPTYEEISYSIAKQLGKGRPLSIPYWMAWCAAKIGGAIGARLPFDSNRLHQIVTSATLNNVKIKREMNWQPMDVLTNYKIK